MAEPAYSPLAQLLTDATFSDLTVTCAGGTTFRLHRVIVGAHSEYFSKACAGPFLEASSGQIDLPDVDPEDFKKLVDFVYTGTYTDYFTPVPHRSVSRKADASASISATVRGLRGKSLGRKPKLFPAVKGLRGKPLDRKPKAIAAVTGPPEEPPDREPKATEPKAFEPKAIKPPIIGRVPPEHLAEYVKNLAGPMGPAVPANAGKRKADNGKGETDDGKSHVDGRVSVPFPHSLKDKLAN
ncbi:hypothetical protein RB601_004376 [Gaeumannomyces tritici]